MPSVIRGSDDFDSDEYGGLGHNQTWQDVTASRSAGVTYTNTTGKPIMVSVINESAVPGTVQLNLYVDGSDVIWSREYDVSSTAFVRSVSTIVPNNSTYSVQALTGTLRKWSELR